ncbi:MAG: GxxExxY protein [Pyrinomonadaceae bacterium]
MPFDRISTSRNPVFGTERTGYILPGPKIDAYLTADFVCFDKIIVEIKAVHSLAAEHRAQVMNYLKATEIQLGLLVNFGHFPKLEYERIVSTRSKRL